MSLEKGWLAIRPFTYTLLSCFASYKLLVSILPNLLPSSQMLDLGASNWFDILDTIWVVALTNFYYFLGILWYYQLSPKRAIIWGVFVGIYSALLLVPFNYYMKIDIAINPISPIAGFSNLLFHIPAILILFIIIPLIFLWLSKFMVNN